MIFHVGAENFQPLRVALPRRLPCPVGGDADPTKKLLPRRGRLSRAKSRKRSRELSLLRSPECWNNGLEGMIFFHIHWGFALFCF